MSADADAVKNTLSMRISILISLTILCGPTQAAEPARSPSASAEYSGYYVSSFEKSLFKPTGSTERWWLSGSYSCADIGINLTPPGPAATVPVFLSVRGKLSEKGKHGHMGAYDRELVVEKTISCRRIRPDEKIAF